jgi:FKBP-type peptidyl-prolyl cis-trans isomerase FkpA
MMKRLALTWMIALAALPLVLGCTSTREPAAGDEKVLYALGVHLGTGLVPLALSPRELEVVEAGLSDGAAGRAAQIDDKTSGDISKLLARRSDARAAAEARTGPAVVAEAAREPGAVTLPSGVVFRELVAGSGAAVVETGKVKAHLRGTLGDGTLIEDTHERSSPVVLPADQVMACWSDALKRMRIGGKAHVVCPSLTAFGEFGKPPIVPPNATVTYDIEVVDAKP